MLDKILQIIKGKHPLIPKDAGDFASVKVSGMKFRISAYTAEGLGHVSVMSAKGFFGLMKMDTVIINPLDVDLPLLSYDRIFVMGNDTIYIELFDTLLGSFDGKPLNAVKDNYVAIPEHDHGTHWYDNLLLPSSIHKRAKKQTPTFNRLADEYFSAFFSIEAPAVSDPAAKRAKAIEYVEGLISSGGPSTDVFKKKFGEEYTGKLFHTVLFGTQCHQPYHNYTELKSINQV